jgi:hypothetical protein
MFIFVSLHTFDRLLTVSLQAESVSNRTTSWLYIAMHNPRASQPFTHFASRRLRLKAPEDLQKIHKQVSSLMTVLKWADRSHSFQSQKEKEQVVQQLKEAEEENQRLREQLRLSREGQST